MNDFQRITDPDVKYLDPDDIMYKQIYECMWDRPEAWAHITYEESILVPSLDPDSCDDIQVSASNGFPLWPCVLSQPPAKVFLHWSHAREWRTTLPTVNPPHQTGVQRHTEDFHENKSTEPNGGQGTVVIGQLGIGQGRSLYLILC